MVRTDLGFKIGDTVEERAKILDAMDASSDAAPSPISKFLEYLRQTVPVFAELMDLKQEGWNNPEGDKHFKNQRQKADTANSSQGGKEAFRFYTMMQQIGDEMQEATGALTQYKTQDEEIQILDLCMAPGGYTASALKYNYGAKACGITLPPKQGGHEVFLNSPRVTVLPHDITMFASEFGVDEVPTSHPEHKSFSTERPFFDQKFDLVFCDGQVLRTHKRAKYREATEANRLSTSQLILALQRIREGGTFIMLLHKIEGIEVVDLLYRFSQFSDIEVFKPKKKHASRSTFYLIAKNVQPDVTACKDAIVKWKKAWWNSTFGGGDGTGGEKILMDLTYMQEVIDAFGTKFTELAIPVWRVQLEGLKKMDWAKSTK